MISNKCFTINTPLATVLSVDVEGKKSQENIQNTLLTLSFRALYLF